MTSLLNDIEILDEGLEVVPNDEAFAAISLNPLVTWIKFILTDDKPNGNNQRVPKTEFANLIKSGIFMPIKMAFGQISEGHGDTFPVGVITHLKEVGDQIRGIGALWSRERPEDIEYIKEEFAANRPLNLSWEIAHESSEKQEDGVENLKNAALRAVTLVGMPAYEGRTPILAVASVWTTVYINNLPDSAFFYIEPGGTKDSEGKTVPRGLRHLPYKGADGKVDPAHLRNAIARAPQVKGISPAKVKSIQARARSLLGSQAELEEVKLDDLEKAKAEAAQALADLDVAKENLTAAEEALHTKEAELAAATTELATLREFKAGIDKEKADTEKLASIKQKFAEAKLEKDDAYFVEHKETLLRLSEPDLDFMIQELVSFAAKKESRASEDPTKVPPLPSDPPATDNVKELADALKARREAKQKKS